MNASSLKQAVVGRVRQRPLLFAGGAVLVLALLIFAFASGGGPKPDLSFFEVRRGDFLISVVEGGTVEAVNETVVRSDFEGTARIIFIVREGTYVKKGDLLVELDSAQAQDQVSQQQINFEKAQFALTQSEQQLKIQQSVFAGEIQAAELKLEFARIDLDKYLKGERDKLRRDAEIEITNVIEQLKIKEDTLEWTKRLYEKGWETKTKLDGDDLAVSQLRLKREQAEKAIWMLTEFDEKKKLKTLEEAVKEATDSLDRVNQQGKRRLEQFEADVKTQQNTLDLSRRKLERDKKQLDACRILAPADGLVVYAGASGDRRFSSESMVEEGAIVRNRQELIKLPDASSMKLEIKIHESHINNIRPSQQAFVVLDSMPDRRFQGVVNKVGLVPDMQSRWGNPNLKLYATQILITDNLPDIKPGVSARAEIVITNLQNVLTVPIQAVTTRKGKQVVFNTEDPPRALPITVGLYNTKFIEITAGLKEGDRVLLSPPYDTQDKDLAGGILGQGEKLPGVNGTNRPPRASTQAGAGKVPAGAPNAPDQPGASPRQRGPGAAAADPGPAAVAGGPGGDRQNAGGERRGGGPRGFNREEMLKQYDKNGDGELDETEQAAMRAALAARFGGQGGGPRLSQEEILKRFDKNGDGELDETERAAMREQLGTQGRGGGARLSREEMLKRFDKNGDGELDEAERATMLDQTGRPGGGGGRGPTNAPPARE